MMHDTSVLHVTPWHGPGSKCGVIFWRSTCNAVPVLCLWVPCNSQAYSHLGP